MNRYVLAAIIIAVTGLPAMAQYPITGATPPWSPPSPRGPLTPTLAPVTYLITDQVITDLRKNLVSERFLEKLSSLKGTQMSQDELLKKINDLVKDDLELREGFNKWRNYVLTYAQVPSPAFVQVPSGKPLIGFYKTDAVYVGADGRYPFDTGEYNLAGFDGNTRFFGQFVITLPIPERVDPLNQPIPYRSLRSVHGSCCCKP